jgi:hypothetical protein
MKENPNFGSSKVLSEKRILDDSDELPQIQDSSFDLDNNLQKLFFFFVFVLFVFLLLSFSHLQKAVIITSHQ